MMFPRIALKQTILRRLLFLYRKPFCRALGISFFESFVLPKSSFVNKAIAAPTSECSSNFSIIVFPYFACSLKIIALIPWDSIRHATASFNSPSWPWTMNTLPFIGRYFSTLLNQIYYSIQMYKIKYQNTWVSSVRSFIHNTPLLSGLL